jgi:hypothetical protein
MDHVIFEEPSSDEFSFLVSLVKVLESELRIIIIIIFGILELLTTGICANVIMVGIFFLSSFFFFFFFR